MSNNPLKARWSRGEPTFGAWLSIPSGFSAELVARQGFDYVCIDMQHGLVDYADYEKPLPRGWKEGGWSTDAFDEYDTGNTRELASKPPPQPAPYQGGRPQRTALE